MDAIKSKSTGGGVVYVRFVRPDGHTLASPDVHSLRCHPLISMLTFNSSAKSLPHPSGLETSRELMLQHSKNIDFLPVIPSFNPTRSLKQQPAAQYSSSSSHPGGSLACAAMEKRNRIHIIIILLSPHTQIHITSENPNHHTPPTHRTRAVALGPLEDTVAMKSMTTRRQNRVRLALKADTTVATTHRKTGTMRRRHHRRHDGTEAHEPRNQRITKCSRRPRHSIARASGPARRTCRRRCE